jgi:hypothetical protein
MRSAPRLRIVNMYWSSVFIAPVQIDYVVAPPGSFPRLKL